MSRSYRKTPIGKWKLSGISSSKLSEKSDKQYLSRKTRRNNKQLLHSTDVDYIDETYFDSGRLSFWDEGVGAKEYFGDLKSCRQEFIARYSCTTYDWYEIETEDDISIVIEQFKLTDKELHDMTNNVKSGYRYLLRRNIKYKLDETYEEHIKDSHARYKRDMRK